MSREAIYTYDLSRIKFDKAAYTTPAMPTELQLQCVTDKRARPAIQSDACDGT